MTAPIRHFIARVGNWKFHNWRLYKLRRHVDAKTGGKNASWVCWDRVL